MLDPEYVRRMGDWFNDRSSNSCVFDEGEEVEVFDGEAYSPLIPPAPEAKPRNASL